MITVRNMQFYPKTIHFCLAIIATVSVIYVFMFSTYFSKMSSVNEVLKPQKLTTNGRQFILDRKPLIIMSGSLHYFRVPHQEWEDRILKLKAMGLNTVDIYIPWNLHEPQPGKFTFEDDSLNISSFLYLIQTYGLYAIVRPGPYICSEWDLGGLPSWLLKDKDMKLRSMYPPYISAVESYFKQLLPILKDFQFSYGGPIIAFQVENEYGSNKDYDIKYMQHLKKLFKDNGLSELLFMCDNVDGLGAYGKVDGVLQTINFMSKTMDESLKKLETFQPGAPVFVTELWDGWFNHWGEKYHRVDANKIADVLKKLLQQKASFNLYMWHGGTSFGFMSGANGHQGTVYKPDITSYDYDAPIGEAGQVRPKYGVLKETIKKYAPKDAVPNKLPWISEDKTFSAYGDVKLEEFLPIDNLISSGELKSVEKDLVCSMEDVDQGYGFVVYSTTIPSGAKSLFIDKARDYVVVTLNGERVFSDWGIKKEISVNIGTKTTNWKNKLLILVENTGRVNFGKDFHNQRKGILGTVEVDGKEVKNWKVSSLDFEKQWSKSLAKNGKLWKKTIKDSRSQPTLYKGELYVHASAPRDTFIQLPNWFKGIVLINGFNLGRYYELGPQKTLYVPQIHLRPRENGVIVFDLHGGPEKYSELPTIESTSDEDLGLKDAVDFLI